MCQSVDILYKNYGLWWFDCDSLAGEFAGTGITARWVVNAAQRQVRYTLCTSEQNRWVGFGISNDRNMVWHWSLMYL